MRYRHTLSYSQPAAMHHWRYVRQYDEFQSPEDPLEDPKETVPPVQPEDMRMDIYCRSIRMAPKYFDVELNMTNDQCSPPLQGTSHGFHEQGVKRSLPYRL